MTKKLRSTKWFSGFGKDAFIHRSWMKNQGFPDNMFDGRPVIGICNTHSELTPCNAHLNELVERVKYGVFEAGGFPVEFSVTSLGESNLRPTAMLFRNLVSMDVEESIRANPIDGVVLMTGCDKTTPALVMGACSVGLPTMVVSGGSMLNGYHKGQRIGSGTDVWKFDAEYKAGRISAQEFKDAESSMSRSAGSCMTMGTASTMASMVDALGLTLPMNSNYPAVDSRRKVLSHQTGKRIVELVKEDIKISDILTKQAFENAIQINGAIGGSTNAVLHLIAIAGRLGINLTLDDWDRLGKNIPTIVNLMPSGEYLMEDFCYAGGLPVVIKELIANNKLHKDALTVNGKTLLENIQGVENYNKDVIKPFDTPLIEQGGMVVLKGNLAPKGAIIKPSAATEALMNHTAKAVVFENIEDYKNRIDDENLQVDKNSILVLKNCGPKGYPGMAEVGNMALPKKLLQQGVTDMVRISDARMSGTAFGTVVLHVAPEAMAGGTLAIVENGDTITLDVKNNELTLHLDPETIKERLSKHAPNYDHVIGGYQRLYVDHVLQADEGCDLDFLVGFRGDEVKREAH